MVKILHLTLTRKWFDLIATGVKKVEYRKHTEYWAKRLMDRSYDEVHFRNGYTLGRPFMRVKIRGIFLDLGLKAMGFRIYLGEILEIKNWDGPKEA